MFRTIITIISLLIALQAQANVETLSTYVRFDSISIERLKTLLNNDSNVEFTDADLELYHEKRMKFAAKEKLNFDQKDVVIDTFISLDQPLFDQFFVVNSELNVKIRINRSSPQVLKDIAGNENINESVRAAALISIEGTEHVPAIISDAFVDYVAPLSSAYSQLQAERGMVYEAFRQDTYYNDLIIAHEGFHSAMRSLTSINRMNRLSKYMEMPLATGVEYDMYLTQDIDTLENISAPNLESVFIDERFTSDHHGTIMASIHHGINQAIINNLVSYDGENVFSTEYPFQYIASERGWSPSFTLTMIEELSVIQESYLSNDLRLRGALVNIAEKLMVFFD